MKEGYVKEFFLRGMIFGGFGPIVYGLVYLILQLTFSGTEVFIGIISTYFLSFVYGGMIRPLLSAGNNRLPDRWRKF